MGGGGHHHRSGGDNTLVGHVSVGPLVFNGGSVQTTSSSKGKCDIPSCDCWLHYVRELIKKEIRTIDDNKKLDYNNRNIIYKTGKPSRGFPLPTRKNISGVVLTIGILFPKVKRLRPSSRDTAKWYGYDELNGAETGF